MSALSDILTEAAEGLPWWGKWIFTVLIAMLPIIELRGALPIAMQLKIPWWIAILLSIAGNMIPIPFIMIFFGRVEKFLRRWRIFDLFFNRLFESTRVKGERKVQVWGDIGLIFFVAIPLPITGAWTGTLAAYLLKLNMKKAFLSIFVGVVIAGFIVTVIYIVGNWLYAGLIVGCLALTLYLIWKIEDRLLDGSTSG